MKRTIIIAVLLTSSMLLSSCWVTTSDFEKYKAKRDEEIKILFCENKVDAYEDLLNSDEPDPTRRDEPDGTRRDLAACEVEFDDIAGANIEACSSQQTTCAEGGTHTSQKCRSCYVKCLNTGTWPTTGVPACP